MINEALDDFTSKQSEDTMVALVKRHESTKLLESVINMPIFYEPKITVTAPPNELNLGLARLGDSLGASGSPRKEN